MRSSRVTVEARGAEGTAAPEARGPGVLIIREVVNESTGAAMTARWSARHVDVDTT